MFAASAPVPGDHLCRKDSHQSGSHLTRHARPRMEITRAAEAASHEVSTTLRESEAAELPLVSTTLSDSEAAELPLELQSVKVALHQAARPAEDARTRTVLDAIQLQQAVRENGYAQALHEICTGGKKNALGLVHLAINGRHPLAL